MSNLLSADENFRVLRSRALQSVTDAQLWTYLFEYARTVELGYAKPVIKEIQANSLRQVHARPSAEWLELYRRATLFAGAYDLDSYMIACEDRRESRARFWLPRRRVLEGKHKIITQIQDFIDDPEPIFLGFSLPPGTGKSTIIKFLLAYIDGRWPKSMNMYVSYADGMVRLIHEAVKSILTDTAEYAHNDIFPGNGSPDISAEYNTISHRRKGDAPTLGLVSLGGSVTGRTRANKFLVTDDLVKDREMASSPTRLEKLYQDYLSTLTTRMIGDKVKQIMLGTIWAAGDPISRMRSEHEGDPRYKFIAIPVWNEDEQSNFEFDHPDNYTAKRIYDIKASLDPVDFSCLYLQRPIEKEGLAFPYDQLKYYNGVLPDGEPDNIIMFTDVAWGGGDSLSMPIAYIYGGDWYIHSVIFDRGDKFVTKPRVAGRIVAHRVRKGRFEANNGGDEYCDDISRQLRERGYSCNLSHKKAPSTMSKMARIEQHAPVIREMYFIDDAKLDPENPKRAYRDEDYRRFIAELTSFSFTAKNKHDDAPDSLAGLADMMNNSIGGTTSRVGRRTI